MSLHRQLLALHIKWRGTIICFENVDPNITTILAIKAAVEDKTGVAPCDQKLMGLGVKLNNPTPADDNVFLSSVSYKNKSGIVHIQLIGTPQAELIEQQTREMELLQIGNNGTVLDDLNLEMTPATREWRKLCEFGRRVEINFINKPRPGKKLIILDLDHTLMHFDSKEEGQTSNTSASTNHNLYQSNHSVSYCEAMKRPYMHYFLTEIYPYYDIAIWSQTHWKWIEIKLSELGMANNPNYKICFILDKSSMFKIPPTGYVKPLHIIWTRFNNMWSKKNTIHIDDMERNFVLNKSTGCLVTPFYRNGYVNAKNDILTHTLAATAYGPGGMQLSAISTSGNNIYMSDSSYAKSTGGPVLAHTTNSTPFSVIGGNNSGGDTSSSVTAVDDDNQGESAGNISSNTNDNKNTTSGSSAFPLIPFGNSNSNTQNNAQSQQVLQYPNSVSRPLHPLPPVHTNVHASQANSIAPNSDYDVELYYLARYLVNVADVEDLSILDHSKWRLHSHHKINSPTISGMLGNGSNSSNNNNNSSSSNNNSPTRGTSRSNSRSSSRSNSIVDENRRSIGSSLPPSGLPPPSGGTTMMNIVASNGNNNNNNNGGSGGHIPSKPLNLDYVGQSSGSVGGYVQRSRSSSGDTGSSAHKTTISSPGNTRSSMMRNAGNNGSLSITGNKVRSGSSGNINITSLLNANTNHDDERTNSNNNDSSNRDGNMAGGSVKMSNGANNNDSSSGNNSSRLHSASSGAVSGDSGGPK